MSRSGFLRRRASLGAVSALLGIGALLTLCAPSEAADTWRARVSAKLLALYDAAGRSLTAASPSSSAASSPFAPRTDASGRVQMDVHYDCTSASPRAALAAAGLSIETTADLPPYCVIEGWALPAVIADLAKIPGVTSVTLPSYALPPHAPGPSLGAPALRGLERAPRAKAQSSTSGGIDSNGVAIMRAGEFVSQTGVSGTGVTVGVQSTGVTSLSTIQQRGELPSVQVLMPSGESTSDLADEGTVLLEEVHAVAPNAGLAFCGPTTFVEYTSCLQQLMGVGATILVDDVIFVSPDPMTLDNADSQAIESLLARYPSVALFTVVGNFNGSYWEGTYTPVSLASQGLATLSCPSSSGTQTDAYVAEFGSSVSEQLTVSQGGSFPLMLAWADPSTANVSRFDVYWTNNSDPTQTGCFSTAGVNDNNINPSVTLNAGTYTLYIGTPDTSSAGKFLKLWFGGDGLTFLSTSTPGGIISAQAYASGAITIGAVNGSDGVGNQIESFSSLGPLSTAFPTPQKVQEPILVAPDGINVDATGTYFAGELFPDGNFYGTSASVPNAGAVAALLRSAFPELTVPQLLQTLTSGAVALGASSIPDDTFGYGRIDALGALATLPAPTITALPNSSLNAGASTAALPFSVTGTGSLHFLVTSTNPALVPATLAAAGAPGVSIAPDGCGVTVSSCTATITAAQYGGTTNVTLSAVDGANRSAPAAMTITINGPAPPPIPPASEASSAAPQTGGGGGAFGWAEVAIFALLAAARASRRTPRVS